MIMLNDKQKAQILMILQRSAETIIECWLKSYEESETKQALNCAYNWIHMPQSVKYEDFVATVEKLRKKHPDDKNMDLFILQPALRIAQLCSGHEAMVKSLQLEKNGENGDYKAYLPPLLIYVNDVMTRFLKGMYQIVQAGDKSNEEMIKLVGRCTDRLDLSVSNSYGLPKKAK